MTVQQLEGCSTLIITRRPPATGNASLPLLSTVVAAEITICRRSTPVSKLRCNDTCYFSYVLININKRCIEISISINILTIVDVVFLNWQNVHKRLLFVSFLIADDPPVCNISRYTECLLPATGQCI